MLHPPSCLAKTPDMDSPPGLEGLPIAEALELLRLSMPEAPHSIGWWSDMDYSLAGAHLIDLSFQGQVDTDVRSATRLQAGASSEAPSPALALLEREGGTAPLEVVLEEIVGRIGDLRAAIGAALQARGIMRRAPQIVAWAFVRQRVEDSDPRPAAALRAALLALIEGDDLPSPQEAALISVLHASGSIAELLDVPSPRKWQARHAARIEAIHRMDLVGQTVAAAIGRMRERLRAYVLGSGGSSKLTRPGAAWEWRAFWPAEGSVSLPAALDLLGSKDRAPEEANTDIYLFVHGKRDNIKLRGKGLKVKPVLEAFDQFSAFGPSGRVEFPAQAQALSGIFPRFNEVRVKLRTREEMISALSVTGYRPGMVTVRKVRRQYRAILGVKVELAQIEVNGRMFGSMSLESRFLAALRVLSRQVAVGPGIVGGYAEFLERVATERA